jgi:hypothetical protein
MPPDLQRLTQDYRIAFLRYLPRREEADLARGYALGRDALVGGTALLDLVHIHHEILAETLEPADVEQHRETVAAAGAFFAEVVAAYEMAQRGLLDRE